MANYTIKVSNKSGALISDPTNAPVITTSAVAAVKSIETGNGLTGGPITTTGTIAVLANSGIYANSSGLFVNSAYISTLAVNSAIYLGTANLQNIETFITSNASAAYTNAVAYVDGKAYVNTSQLSSNLANYQTTAGLASNVAVLTSNNSTFAYGKTEINLNVNNALTANSSTFLGTANLQNIQTFITSNAGAAYSNAVSYVDGKSYVNTSQLSSNLANYALLTGATFSGNVRTQQSAQVDGNLVVSGNLTVTGNVTVIGANNLSVVDNMIYLNSNSVVSNPDLGFAGNYNDGVYRHTGFFRDASDGVWKVFDSYLPEPDASPYIDTTNTSFKIANFQANIVYVGNTTVYSTINTTSFSGTANNATYAYGKSEINLNVNNALYANASISNLFTVGTTAYFVSNGYIGIGTNSPNYRFAINGGVLGSTLGSTANTFQIYSTTTNVDYLNFSKVRQAVGSDWTTAAWRIQHVVDATSMAYIQFSGNGNLQGLSFGTQNAERVRIDSSGNVGIGNTAPDAKLAITGTANISGNVVIGGITTHNANVILGTSGLSANGGFGTAGQVLTSSGATGNVYWSTASGGGGITTGKAIAMALIFG